METLGLIATRPIVFLDTETTGIDTENDKIVQLALIKLFPDGRTIELETLLDPEILIPKEASDVHGITNEMVAGQKKFKDIAVGTSKFLDNCDLAGYNSNAFDIPLLSNEFARCGIIFPDPDAKLIDGYVNECRKTSRKLSDTYTRYTGETLENAHSALADTRATMDVIISQCASEGRNISVEELAEMTVGNLVDWAGKMKYNENNVPCWTFGKNINKPIYDDANYLEWFVKQPTTPRQTKAKIKEEIELYEAMLTDHLNGNVK